MKHNRYIEAIERIKESSMLVNVSQNNIACSNVIFDDIYAMA